MLFSKFWPLLWPQNHRHQETFTSLWYMLFKIWDMYMHIIMNMTVCNSAYVWVYLLNAKLWVRPKAKLKMYIRNAHIKSVNFWESMVVFNQHLIRKVWLLRIQNVPRCRNCGSFHLHISKFNNFPEHCLRLL